MFLQFFLNASPLKQHPESISRVRQKQYMEATRCSEQDVVQDVGFKGPEYRPALPARWRGTTNTPCSSGCSCHVAGGNAASTPSAAAAPKAPMHTHHIFSRSQNEPFKTTPRLGVPSLMSSTTTTTTTEEKFIYTEPRLRASLSQAVTGGHAGRNVPLPLLGKC